MTSVMTPWNPPSWKFHMTISQSEFALVRTRRYRPGPYRYGPIHWRRVILWIAVLAHHVRRYLKRSSIAGCRSGTVSRRVILATGTRVTLQLGKDHWLASGTADRRRPLANASSNANCLACTTYRVDDYWSLALYVGLLRPQGGGITNIWSTIGP